MTSEEKWRLGVQFVQALAWPVATLASVWLVCSYVSSAWRDRRVDDLTRRRRERGD